VLRIPPVTGRLIHFILFLKRVVISSFWSCCQILWDWEYENSTERRYRNMPLSPKTPRRSHIPTWISVCAALGINFSPHPFLKMGIFCRYVISLNYSSCKYTARVTRNLQNWYICAQDSTGSIVETQKHLYAFGAFSRWLYVALHSLMSNFFGMG
jgi:hypothetical protein